MREYCQVALLFSAAASQEGCWLPVHFAWSIIGSTHINGGFLQVTIVTFECECELTEKFQDQCDGPLRM